MIAKMNLRAKIILSTVFAMCVLAAALMVIIFNITFFLSRAELKQTLRPLAKIAAASLQAKIDLYAPFDSFLYFADTLANIRVSPNSSAFVINEYGYLLAHSDTVRASPGEMVFIEHRHGARLRYLISGMAGQAGSESVGYGFSQAVFSFAPIGSTGLVLIIETPLSDFSTAIRSAIIFSVSAILILLVIVILAADILIRRFITMPLKLVTESARNINKGIFVNQLPLPLTSGQDEIGSLSAAFVSMSQSVERLILEIEQIASAVGSGKLHEKMDASLMQGDFFKIVSGMNNALDLICSHMDTIPVAVALFNEKKEILYRNSAMDDFLLMHDLQDNGEILLERLAGSGIFSSNSVLDSKVAAIFDPALLNPVPYTADIALLGHEGGSNFNMTIQKVRTKNAPNKSSCVMLLLNNVTLLTRAKIDAEQASLAKSEFLSRMSHEIRTPMNVVMGMAEIARRTDDMEKILECLDQIENSSNHLVKVINDILDFSKLESGKFLLNVSEFSLSTNIDFVISMMLSRARSRNISIRLFETEIKNDILFTDSLRLNQVLINLIANAIKFSPDGSEILLNIRELGVEDNISTYIFEVIDQGIGISEYQAAKLFMPFEQGDRNIASRYGGTGLGLIISKSLVEMMGGKITLDSEPGKGSKFTFTVRCESKPKPDITPDEEALLSDQGGYDFSEKRCLVVDDIEINRSIVMELLSTTNLILETAVNGQEAVDKFRSKGGGYFDIILMDIQMPVMDGYAATEEIRRVESHWAKNYGYAKKIPVIAMTANVMQDDMQKAMDSGMNAHLGKPIVLATTLKTIREQFEKNLRFEGLYRSD